MAQRRRLLHTARLTRPGRAAGQQAAPQRHGGEGGGRQVRLCPDPAGRWQEGGRRRQKPRDNGHDRARQGATGRDRAPRRRRPSPAAEPGRGGPADTLPRRPLAAVPRDRRPRPAPAAAPSERQPAHSRPRLAARAAYQAAGAASRARGKTPRDATKHKMAALAGGQVPGGAAAAAIRPPVPLPPVYPYVRLREARARQEGSGR